MSDESIQLPPGSPVPAAAPAAGPTEQEIQLQQLAAFAFGDPMPEVIDPASPAAIVNTPAPAAAAPAAETVVDPDAFIKSTFGVESLDAFKSEWQQLQDLKKNPPKAGDPVWKDDNAKKIAASINSEQYEPVLEYLQAKKSLSGLDTMNDEQKLKLFIKLQNPMYDQELVDYQYGKDFKFDDSAFKDENGNVTDQLGLRFAKTQALQKAQNELNKANEFFGAYKTKLELPAVETQQTALPKEYEDYQASNARSQEFYEKSIAPALKALSEKDVPLSFKVQDTSNQMDFEVPLVVEKGDFDAAKTDALDYAAYLRKTFYDAEGNFLASKMQRAIVLERNFDKYAQSIARQAVNAERERVINKEGGQPGSRRDYNTVEVPTELQNLEKMVFPGN